MKKLVVIGFLFTVFVSLGLTPVRADHLEEKESSLQILAINPYEDLGHPQPWPKGMEPVIVINSDVGKALAEANRMGSNVASLGLYQLTVFTQGSYSGTYALIDCTNPQVKYSDNVSASVLTSANGPGFIQAGWIKNGPNVTEKPGDLPQLGMPTSTGMVPGAHSGGGRFLFLLEHRNQWQR